MRNNQYINAILLSASMSLAGCSGSEERDILDYINEVKNRPAIPIKPLPEQKSVENFIYLPGNHRNPFQEDQKPEEDKNFLLNDNSSSIHPDPLRVKELLENYGLDSLKMVGVVNHKREKWALVKAPDGVVHKAKVGGYLGKNDGKIEAISDTEISIMEILPDKKPGQWFKQEATLLLSIKDKK